MPTPPGGRDRGEEDAHGPLSPSSAAAHAPSNTIVGGVHGTAVQAGVINGDVVIMNPPPAPVGGTATDEEHAAFGRVPPGDLQVHAAVLPAPGARTHALLTPYLPRDHDDELRRHLRPAVRGQRSVLVMLTGESSTGKTRALYEALRDLAPQRALLRPRTTEDLIHLLRSERVDDRSILWLNEAQTFFRDDPASRQAAADLHRLLRRRVGIVAVGTLWTRPYWEELTRSGTPGDPYAQVRELLTGPSAHRIQVPDHLTPHEQAAWKRLAANHGDRRMSDAVEAGAGDRGRVVQHLSGGPELLAAYLAGPGAHFTAVEHALVTAAVDARRLGHRSPLPGGLLARAADSALHPRERSTDPEWASAALRALCTGERPGGERTDIRRALTALATCLPRSGAVPAFAPDDYLDQQLRTRRADELGSDGLWQALLDHTADPHDLYSVARAAQSIGLVRYAVRFYRRALIARHPNAAVELVDLLSSETDPHRTGTYWTVDHVDITDPWAVSHLLEQLRYLGRGEAVARLLQRDPARHTDIADPSGTAHLLDELRHLGRGEAVARLLQRDPARNAGIRDLTGTARLLLALHRLEQEESVDVLTQRITARADVEEPRDLALLLESLRQAGRTGPARNLASRAARIDATSPAGVAALLGQLHLIGQHTAVMMLGARAAVEANVGRVDEVTDLLAQLHRLGQEDMVSVLGSRVAREGDLTDPSRTARLLNRLRLIASAEASALVLARDPAAQADVAHPLGVARLMSELAQVGGAEGRRGARILGARAAARTDVGDTSGVVPLLAELARLGRAADVAVLASRAAAHADTTHPSSVVRLLRELDGLGRAEDALVLASRAATHTRLAVVWGIDRLCEELRRTGQAEALRTLERRRTHEPHSEAPVPGKPYGREPDGAPASPWTWDALFG